jgi:hypothetical protein
VKWGGRRIAVIIAVIAVTALLSLAVGYSVTRALVAVHPAPGIGADDRRPESRGSSFEVEDATVKKVDLVDSRVELASDLLGIFGARLLVTDGTEITLDGRQARLADLPEGARARASYVWKDGLRVARTISAETPEPEPPPTIKR